MVKITLVGAGSSVFGYNSVLDAVNIPQLQGAELVLHDIDKVRLDTMTGLAHRMNQEMGDPLYVSSTLNQKDA